MGGKLVYATTVVEEAHLFLEAVRPEFTPNLDGASREFLAALKAYRGDGLTCECREDPNADLPFQVWSAPVEYIAPLDVPEGPVQIRLADLDDDALDAIAERLAAKLGKAT